MTPTDLSVIGKLGMEGRLPAPLVFFLRWLANPLKVGSVFPSGPGLRELIVRNTRRADDEIIVEFGAGTGPVTKALLDAGHPGAAIHSFEIDEKMVAFLRGNFPDVNIIHGDCRDVEKLIPAEHVGRVGTLIVGIPMLSLPMDVQRGIVDAIFRVLPPGGRFILFTYSLFSPLKRDVLGLRGERLGFTTRNFPPASLWAYRKA